MGIDGILNVDKPAGKTSFEVVSLVRRWSGERRVGHAGTLDPLATGVLPICLGQGTRVAEYLAEASKIYRAEVELGISTDTYDASGKVTARHDASGVTRKQVEEALAHFRGSISQIPPMYSALRWEGRRLYQLARAGVEVPRKARRADLFRLELLDWQPPLFTIEVECSKGTYIRSLAHDLGQVLGCGSHLRNLIRLKNGPFHLGNGIALSHLEEAFLRGYWHNLLYPIDVVLLHWKAAVLGQESEQAIANGQSLPLEVKDDTDGGRCRAYSLDGRIVALLHWEPASGLWHPYKVFSSGGLSPA